jgi:hypothetical protein
MQQGVAGVRSPLDLLHELTPEDVRATLQATSLLSGAPSALPLQQ